MMENESECKNVQKSEALAICRDFLGEPWQNVSLEEFRFSEMRGGFSNSLYLCALPPNLQVVGDDRISTPREVVLRIYGAQQDSAHAVVSESVTFVLLSERGLGPKLYGIFPKGRLEQYIPSHILSPDEMQLYSSAIARQMAKIHALEVPVEKKPEKILQFITKWHNKAEKILKDSTKKFFMSFNEYGKEIDWIKEEIAQLTSPVVYCHNDLQGGNVLYREDVPQHDLEPQLVFIDFEVGAYNYRNYDFATYFVERCFDYDVRESPYFKLNQDRFPSEQEQVAFFSAYMEQFSREMDTVQPSFRDVDSLLREIPFFACLTLLCGSLWAATMVLLEKSGLGHREYENARMLQYKKFKEQYLKLSENRKKSQQ